MAYWLMKSDPETYSYSDLERDKKTVWDGVSNNLALMHLRSMRRGDLTLIYHSGGEKALVGIAEIVSAPYPDPKETNPKLVVVDVVPKRRLARPVTLSEIKLQKKWSDFQLVRMPRLSVMPVSVAVWERLLKMAERRE